MTRTPSPAARRVPPAVWRRVMSRISGGTLRHVKAAGHDLHAYRDDRDAHGAAAEAALTAQARELHALLAAPLLTYSADQVNDALARAVGAVGDPADADAQYLRADAALGRLIGHLTDYTAYAQTARELIVLRQYDLAAQRDAAASAAATAPNPAPAATATGTQEVPR